VICASAWFVTTTTLTQRSADGVMSGSIRQFRTWTIESEAEGITAPVQLILGSDDPYGSLDQTDRIEARVRRPVERVVLPGGHSAHLEHSDAVVAAVAGFVQRLG
jgi:pimeloyl-ACP methyl ester carboxylesterase